MNGLKKRLNYPDFTDLVSSYDVFCLCETHIDDTDIVDIKNYNFIAKNRKKSYKRKSGGVGVYVRNEVTPFVQVLPNESEYALWLSILKDFTHYDENLILCTLYVPPENSRFFTEEHFSLLENEISKQCDENKYVYLVGDTNSRVGSMRDFVLSDPHLNNAVEIDDEIQLNLHKHKILEDLYFNLERNSRDKKINTNGIENINYEHLNNLIDQLNTYPQSSNTIEYITDEIRNLFHNSATLTFPAIDKKSFNQRFPHNKEWFGPKCHKAREKYNAANNDYQRNKTIENKVKLNFASTKKTNEFLHKKTDKINKKN